MTQTNGNGNGKAEDTESIEVYRKIETEPEEIPEAIWTKEGIDGDDVEVVPDDEIPPELTGEDSTN